MKKSVLFLIAAVIAFCMTSCGERGEKPLKNKAEC